MFERYNYIIKTTSVKEIAPMDVIIQLIGGLGIIASIISFQRKKHSSIILFRTLCELLFAVHYFLLGAYTGMIMNLVGCVRNTVFTRQVAKNKKTTISTVAFSLLFLIFGVLFWQGKKSILIIVAKVLSTLAYGKKNTTMVRGIILITTTSWFIYNYFVFSIPGMVCEAFTLASLIIGIIRLDLFPKLRNKKEDKQEICDQRNIK